jgi:hypothetical protein
MIAGPATTIWELKRDSIMVHFLSAEHWLADSTNSIQ